MKTQFVRLAAAFCAAVVVVALPGSVLAQSTVNTTLDSFLPGGNNAGGLTIGDKRYSNFTFSSTGDAPIDADTIDVALTGSDTQHQIRFSFVRDALEAPGGQTTDVVICYQVDVIGNQLINGVGLAFDPSVVGGTAGAAAASVSETVQTTDESPLMPGSDSDIALLTVFHDGPGELGDNATDSLVINPTRSLLFCKDILVSSRPEGGRVAISTVDNFVTQVPEPASAALLVGAGGILLARRRSGASRA